MESEVPHDPLVMSRADHQIAACRARPLSVGMRQHFDRNLGCGRVQSWRSQRWTRQRHRRSAELMHQGGPGRIPGGPVQVVTVDAWRGTWLHEWADPDSVLISDDDQMWCAEQNGPFESVPSGLAAGRNHEQVSVACWGRSQSGCRQDCGRGICQEFAVAVGVEAHDVRCAAGCQRGCVDDSPGGKKFGEERAYGGVEFGNSAVDQGGELCSVTSSVEEPEQPKQSRLISDHGAR